MAELQQFIPDTAMTPGRTCGAVWGTSQLSDVAKFLSRPFTAWKSKQLSQRLFTTAAVVSAATLFVKVVAVGKETLVAYNFGTSSSLDEFLIAMAVLSFVVNVFVGASYNALMPTYIHVREHEGSQKAESLFTGISLIALFFFLLITVIVAVCSRFIIPIFAVGFDPAARQLTRHLFMIMTPIIVLNGFSSLWGTVLNSHERFLLVAFSPAVINVSILIFMLLFSRSMGVVSLGVGTLVGYFVQSVIVAVAFVGLKIPIIPRRFVFNTATWQVLKEYFPMVISALVQGGSNMVDQVLASTLGTGAVSMLNYGYKLVTMIFSVLEGLWTTLFPVLSKQSSMADWKGIKQNLRKLFCLTTYLIVPVTVVLMFCSRQLVELFYQHGAFSKGATWEVNRVQIYFLAQVPFYVVNIVMARLLSSLKMNYIIMLGTLVNLALNVVCDYVFMRLLGVPGIALSTTIVFAVSCSYLGVSAYRKLNRQCNT